MQTQRWVCVATGNNGIGIIHGDNLEQQNVQFSNGNERASFSPANSNGRAAAD